MNFKEENIALFDAYCQNEMDAIAKKEFENKLENNSDFKAEFENFKAFESAISDSEITAFKTKLGQWDAPKKELPPKKNSKIIPLRLFFAAAVAVLGFFTVNYFFTSLSNQELATNYFEPYDNVVTIRGAKEEIDNGLLLYEQNNFSGAIEIFSEISNNTTAVFYKAESYLALKNYTKAVLTYEKIINQESIFQEVAEFHLSLSYLGLDQKEKAEAVLQNISKESDYYTQAQELLETL